MALLTIFFFHELVVGGKTFVSPDTVAPAGFARQGEISLWKDHVYPLWNPFVFLGMPSFASGTYNPLIYPPDWPLAIVQKVVPLPDMTWLLLYYFLGGFFFWLLAVEWGARSEGALLGAVAFVFAPNLVAVGSHGHGSQLVDSAYLPLLLWLATRWLRRGALADLGWLALAGGFQLLRGHVQICFYTWIAVALFTLVHWIAAARGKEGAGVATARALGIAGAALLAFGVAGFYNLPLRDYARWSIRGGTEGGGVGMEYATGWSLAPFELPTLVIPAWTGFGSPTYWGAMPFTDYPNAYLGMVTLVLAVPAFLANGAPRVFALALGTFALMVSFGKYFPLYGFLYEHVPLFNKFRIPVMVVILVQLAAALGAAWGWSAVLPSNEPAAPRGRKVGALLIAVAAALAVLFVVGVMGQEGWHAGYVANAVRHRLAVTPLGNNMYNEQAAEAAFQQCVASIRTVCLLGLLTVGVAWFARRGRVPALAATLGVMLLLMIELWPVSGRVMKPVIGDFVPHSLEVGRDDVVRFLEQAGPPGSFRVLPLEEAQSNRYAGFGIASVGGYHAAKPRLFQDFMDRNLIENLAWLRLLNVRYVIVSQPFQAVPPFLREAHRGDALVYENLLALPRATVIGAWRRGSGIGAVLDSVAAIARDPAGMEALGQTTWLFEDPGTLGPVTGARADIVSYRLNDVTIDVTTPGPALLRLADLWYPDWTATVDGRAEKVLQADALLRAVKVPAGRHRVVFRFHSPAFRAGLVVSLASLAAILALFGLTAWRRRPREGARAAPGKGTPGREAA